MIIFQRHSTSDLLEELKGCKVHIFIIIGPMSDHCITLSLTHSQSQGMLRELS